MVRARTAPAQPDHGRDFATLVYAVIGKGLRSLSLPKVVMACRDLGNRRLCRPGISAHIG
jgi:hypothetical protein